MDATVFILIVIFALVIGSFVFSWIVRSALDSSEMMKKIEKLERDVAELRRNGNSGERDGK